MSENDQRRTSITDPLRIAEVKLPKTNGIIGMTLCPGKKGHSAFGGYWDRDLAVDMKAVAAWKADSVVTLMEEDELEKYHAAGLGQAAEELGMKWHHLPIPDVDVPKDIFQQRWRYSGARLRNHLRKGERVLLHCRGGLGRTGTVAAQLLVELGWKPDSAIQEVRNKRPGAIETYEQEEYARGLQLQSEDSEDFSERLYGCLFGGAIGDALGYLVEFDDYERIIDTYGTLGITDPISDDQAIVSDDTQMTLFTLEGLLRAIGSDIKTATKEIQHAYNDWYYTQQKYPPRMEELYGRLGCSPTLQIPRAPGNTCLGALAGGVWGTPEHPINNSKGCGTVMRVAPVGLFSEWLDDKAAFEVGRRTGAITHGHVTAGLAAGAMAYMIRSLYTGEGLIEAAEGCLDFLIQYPGNEETTLALRKAVKAASGDNNNYVEEINTLWGDPRNEGNDSLGWIAEEALAIGVYAALKGNRFREVIRIAANHGGDSDSTASIAGQLYGAWRGLKEIPHSWIRRLDVFDDILQVTSGCLQP